MLIKEVVLGILIFVSLAFWNAQSDSPQSENRKEVYPRIEISAHPMFNEAIGTRGSLNPVCFSTCKYKGDKKPYVGVSRTDDDSCTKACEAAKKKCEDDNSTSCTYVDGSCKYTNADAC